VLIITSSECVKALKKTNAEIKKRSRDKRKKEKWKEAKRGRNEM